MEKFQILNQKFYMLYGELHENKIFLSEKQHKYMQEKLFEQYSLEFDKIFLPKIIDDKFLIFNLKRRKAGKVPWTFFIFRNKIAKVLVNIIKEEVEGYRQDIQDKKIEI